MKLMMKRFLILLFLPLLLLQFPAALAEEKDPEAVVRKSLVEKYGYTQEEAQAFVFEKRGENVYAYYDPAHPEWTYERKHYVTYERKPYVEDDRLTDISPFSSYTANLLPAVDEKPVRQLLREAGEKGWFRDWNKANRKALLIAMEEKEIYPSPALQEAANAAQAVHLFFVSAYDEEFLWSPALWQWRNETLAENGLDPSDIRLAPASSSPDGIFLEKVLPIATPTNLWHQEDEIVYFAGVPPLALRDALEDSRLKGWTLVSGLMEGRPGSTYEAMTLYEKEGERLLLLAYQNPEDPWTLQSVDVGCLLPGRTPKIRCWDRFDRSFALCYDDPGQPSYTFLVTPIQNPSGETCRCALAGCVMYDRETGTGWLWEISLLTEYHADGTQARINDAPAVPSGLDQISMDDFPLTAEAIRAWKGTPVPEGFAVTHEVHLRAKTSSRSNDLGTFKPSALVQIEETLPGDPWPWYRVKCGRIEGYAASGYVNWAPGDLQSYPPLPVARAEQDIFLRQNTGLFSPSVTELPEGTEMHVLLEKSGWLYVCVPRDEIGWAMDVNGVYGYVRADEVAQAPSLAQLRWNALKEE